MQFCDVINTQMAKVREQKLAEELYIKGKKTNKEIAELVGVSEKTIGEWVEKFKWKERRNALLGSTNNGIQNLKVLVDLYAEKLIEMEQSDTPDPKERARLTDALAKANKTLESFEKDNKIPYSVYINVMELIMGDMLAKIEPKHHLAVLEFFENHTNELALKY
jgi:phage terminase Nu1 subunit (DNA packaging protein)